MGEEIRRGARPFQRGTSRTFLIARGKKTHHNERSKKTVREKRKKSAPYADQEPSIDSIAKGGQNTPHGSETREKFPHFCGGSKSSAKKGEGGLKVGPYPLAAC